MMVRPALFVFLLIAASLSGGCSSLNGAADRGDGTVTHVVVCWLKQPGDEAGRARLIEAARRLEKIPGVVGIEAGRPIASDRDVVVRGYDVALSVTFRNEQALREYDQHPIHRAVINDTVAPLVAKFIVYDFRNE